VDVKTNAPNLLRRQLRKVKPGLVSLSTVTDPYQPVEKRYKITRACLQELSGGPLSVSILTKSDLILRDLDVLARMKNLDIGLTITTLDERLRKMFEPRAPSMARRLRALQELSAAGIRTWVFLGPVLPSFSDGEKVLGEMLTAFRQRGARRVLVDRLNFYPRVWGRVRSLVTREFPDRLASFQEAKKNGPRYAFDLSQRVKRLARELDLTCDIVF
jgi:DNA repair photolyase